MAVIAVLILILLIPTSQDLIHWLMIVGICVRLSKFDFDDSLIMTFPLSPNECFKYFLQSSPTLTYLILLSDSSLVDEGFATYGMIEEGFSVEVEDIVTQL